MELGILGTSIWQQNLPLMERLTIDRQSRDSVLLKLKKNLGLSSLIYLPTCNRVEFIYTIEDSEGIPDSSNLLHRLVDFFFTGNRSISFFPNDFYHYSGRQAIGHLFRMVSSLESLVVGETQITGQFKQAYKEASSLGMVDELMDKLASQALLVAARVKRETKIGNGNLSIASLAIKELRGHLKNQTKAVVALVGSGEMNRKIGNYLKKDDMARPLFVSRSLEKAERLASEFGGDAIELAEFISSPPPVSAIVSATASTNPVFDSAFASRLKEYDKKIICIDLAVPRDFSAEFVKSNSNPYVDMPVLKSRGEQNLRKKFVETSLANEIIRQAVQDFISDRIEISLKPIFVASHQKSLRMARRAFTDLFKKRVTSLSADEEDAVFGLVTKLIGHSAFRPAKELSNRLVQTNDRINIRDLQDRENEKS